MLENCKHPFKTQLPLYRCTLVRITTFVSVSGFHLGIFFGGGGKIYCYANFFCYAIVFGPNFKERQKFSGGALWKKARFQNGIRERRSSSSTSTKIWNYFLLSKQEASDFTE